MMNQQRNALLHKISEITPQKFDQICMEVFHYQAEFNPLYAEFISLLGLNHKDITNPSQIPFLPISFFKTKTIKTGEWETEKIFSSSGTSGMQLSQHHVQSTQFYLQNCVKGFEKFYGSPENYAVMALLPAYLEREGSSLIYMAEHFIKLSNYSQSGFFLYEHDKLAERLNEMIELNLPVLLLGVSFALLDFAEAYPMALKNTIIMETGGMKGRRKELLREEMHATLSKAFELNSIHSEYGMTELMSQGYSKEKGIFYPSDTLRILIRDSTDPLCLLPFGRNGAINLIDLANIDTCAFIATDDLGKVYADGSFEVLGRFDAADIRGCNLLVG
jgi:phenylacetate-coenzyme A ligase PaaK-like adenylate-forming protein